jgi:gas vesicle protein
MEAEIISQILKSYGSVGVICAAAYLIIKTTSKQFLDLLDKKNNQITKLAEGQVLIMKEIADNMIKEIHEGRERADRRHEETMNSQREIKSELERLAYQKKK